MSANIYFVVQFLFLGLGCSAQSADFDEVRQASGSDFEFVFHNEYNLLVVLQENKCYYYGLTDEAEYHLLTEDERHRVEGELADMILHAEQNGYIRESSVGEMRNTYKDVLADFYCIGKDVFVIDIPSEDAQRLFKLTTTEPTTTTTTTTTPTTTTTTTTTAADNTDFFDFTTTKHPLGGLNEAEEKFLDSILGR